MIAVAGGSLEVWRIGPDYWAVLVLRGRPRATKGPFSDEKDAWVAVCEAQIEIDRRLREAGLGSLTKRDGGMPRDN